MTWVKICGTTNFADAQLAWEAGADAIGFVFVQQSHRYLTPDDAHKISSELARPIERIGVIADWPVSQILDLVGAGYLSGLQLHGSESPLLIRELRSQLPTLRLIKTLHVDSAESLIEKVQRLQDCGLDNLLLDSANGIAGGGTGQRFDWEMASLALARSDNKLPILIAGGLTPENVADVIASFHPFGVDVVSGIEHKPGKKDPDKLRAFIQAARTVTTATIGSA